MNTPTWDISDELRKDLGRKLLEELREWVRQWIGEPCNSFAEGCNRCDTWKALDELAKHIDA